MFRQTLKISSLALPPFFNPSLSSAGTSVTPLKKGPERQIFSQIQANLNNFSAWAFWGPQSKFLVRAISDSTLCPTLKVDSTVVSMTTRQNRNPSQFPVSLCEAEVSSSAREIRLNDNVVPHPALNPKRIVIIGDTGCQVKDEDGKMEIQNCNNPKKWPFPKIAKAAADWGPDLFIHVGDYHYRESNCPPGNEECQGAISGDNWASWKQDFFDPVKPLLSQAPGIFVRGNHETCARAGNGYFYLLDPRSVPTSCIDQTDPYEIKFRNGLQLSVIDSAVGENIAPSLEKVIDALRNGDRPWILSHRPFLSPESETESPPLPSSLLSSLSAPGKIHGVIAGHKHMLSFNQFTNVKPSELIIGNGGAKLNKTAKDLVQAFTIQNSADQSSAIYPMFGFVTLELKDSVWDITIRDVKGDEVGHCQILQNTTAKTQLTCASVQN